MPAPDSGHVGRELRLAELLAALSLASDLAKNLPPESALRNSLVAVGLGQRLGLSAEDLSDVYYLSLLHHVGCTGAAVFAAQLAGGDDVDFFFTFVAANHADMADMIGKSVTKLGRNMSAVTRLQTALKLATSGQSLMKVMHASSC